MPGFLQHITDTSYGYVDPYVEKARNMVPLLDTTVQRMEPYFPPVIQAADLYIDAAQNTAGLQVAILQGRKAALQGKVSGFQDVASAKVQQLFGGVRASALVLMDRSDALVDRLLPPDDFEEKARKDKANSGALVSRALKIPFQIPLRFSRVALVKAGDFSEAVMWLSSEQKRKILNFITHSSHLISDKVVSTTAPGRAVLSSGRASVNRRMQVAYQSLVDAEEVIVVWVGGRFSVVVKQLRLSEFKDWTVTKAVDLKQVTAMATTRATQGAYVATSRVVGDNRAVLIFDKIGLHSAQENKPETALQRVEEKAQELIEEAAHIPQVNKPETAALQRSQEAAQELIEEAVQTPVNKPETTWQGVQEETQEMIEEARSMAAKCA